MADTTAPTGAASTHSEAPNPLNTTIESSEIHYNDAAPAATSKKPVHEDMLQTDTRMGLTEHEVLARRKKYGLNQMKEGEGNLILKFLGYFIGPIQFVIEVCFDFHISRSHNSCLVHEAAICDIFCNLEKEKEKNLT